MAAVTILCGIPGSGKSTYAKTLEKEGYICFNADNIRNEFKLTSTKEDNVKAFNILYKRANKALSEGKNIILDNTNMSIKDRIRTLNSLRNVDNIDVVIIARPFEECVKANENKDRKSKNCVVPYSAMEKMYKRFEMPTINEPSLSNCNVKQYDSIKLYYPNAERNYYGHYANFYKTVMDYDQHNKHHKETLGKHILHTVWNIQHDNQDLDKESLDLIVKAAYIHDEGKLFCQTISVEVNEITGNFKAENVSWKLKPSNTTDSSLKTTIQATYHNHMNTGAWDSLFFDGLTDEEKIKISAIITHHDDFYSFPESDHNFAKLKRKLGEDLYEKTLILHKADEASHNNLYKKGEINMDTSKTSKNETTDFKRCGNCSEFGTVNCSETYREPTENDNICDSYEPERD
jgi:predicted kinase